MDANLAIYALEHSPQPTLMLDSIGIISYANQAALELAQATPAQLLGQPFLALLNEGSVNKGRALLAAAQRGPTQLYELNQLTSTGQVVLINYRALPFSPDQRQDDATHTVLFGQPLAQTVATTERLLALNRRHHALYTIAVAASRSLVLSELLQRALDVTMSELDFQAGAVLLNDDLSSDGDSELRPVAQHGFVAGFAVPERFLALHSAALVRGESLLLNSDTDDLGIASNDLTVPLGPLMSVAAVPFQSERQTQGWLLVLTDRYRAFNIGTMETLGTIGNLLGPVIANVHQVAEMNQLKDDFVAAAAHDLKTPVTAVKGYAQMTLRLAQRQDWQQLAPHLEMINARTSELAQIIEALLDISRVQAGRLTLDVEQCDMRDLVADVRDYFEFDLHRQRRELQIELPDAPLRVAWDVARIERVLINLIANALKYSPGGQLVTLRIRAPGPDDQIELSVTDHGIGIAPIDRARIFGRFYRAPSVVAEGFKGTGLGLYIVAQIVAAHQGQVRASDALHGGPGTTMYVTLPRITPS